MEGPAHCVGMATVDVVETRGAATDADDEDVDESGIFVRFPQLDTPSTPGVFVFTMKWGHACADISLFV